MGSNLTKMTQYLFRTEEERKVTLTRSEQEKIFQIDPSFQSISEAVYFDNYDLPCPVRVSIATEDNKVILVVLRKNRHGDVRKEIQILRALKEFGLPVPKMGIVSHDGKTYLVTRGNSKPKVMNEINMPGGTIN